MDNFKNIEKQHQSNLKFNIEYFSLPSREDGFYITIRDGYKIEKPYSFCLPYACASENLFYEIRDKAKHYINSAGIVWHGEPEGNAKDGNPCVHLLDSQVCCLNFLFPFALNHDALVRLLKPIYPNIKRVIPMEDIYPGQYISFEWIGLKNYLKEIGNTRKRGQYATSADAAIMFETCENEHHIILIEWKYTEGYSNKPLRYSSYNRDRVEIYKYFYYRDDFPLNKKKLKNFEDLFFDPFDQMLRLQLLANEMEIARELGSNHVSLLYIHPDGNNALNTITSQNLKSFGTNVFEVWRNLVLQSDRFFDINTQDFFAPILRGNNNPELDNWRGYIMERYKFINS